MAAHNDLGKWGEQVAADYLAGKGWKILHRDWQYEHNISFSDHVIFPNYNQSENEFDCILLRRIYGS